MPYQSISFEAEGPIAIVTLNRPQRRNALSLELMSELIACFDEIGRDRSLRAVILAAAGKVFCSGHDLGEMVGRDINEYRQIFDVCTELMTNVQSIPQPVIAQVQGIATAAGCQLVATCDLAVASDQAAFATPGVKIGLFCTTPMVALSRAIGRKRALQMLMTGDMIDALTAVEWGLINIVVPAAELEQPDSQAGGAHRRSQLADGRLGQAGVLHSDRPRPAQGLCLRQGSDEHELAGRRRAGRNLRLPREAPGVLGREVAERPLFPEFKRSRQANHCARMAYGLRTRISPGPHE